ncbi:hydroxymethylglutaryl-CoA synthase family protein [Pseudomonas sp. H3(2019)]|uniref:hydroxymethylglutaryl-CoA synthase family protein n=1 Tax=Pseudomonas sp. H3(2019) TaxID=2598724 RepID=UPI001193C6D2|nr:hydroxymethylglutaryl-CoA synthase [Pseudomonas sp. H3(2019)]TVT86071.1 hydroxymethylglutaryl-CoA synthase family protein [Pseudomonas sp. H3(2019)]
MHVGIEALNVYCGIAQIPVATLFEARGLDSARLDNLMMMERAVALPFEDPITNAVNAALPILEQMSEEEKNAIAVLIIGSESGIDYSKSISSYVHAHLGLSRNCRIMEVKQACFASTAAVQMAVGYLASGVAPGAKVLIIGTDVALVDQRAEYMEPTVGHGAAAILLAEDGQIARFDLGAFGNYSFETMDSARPTSTFEIADVDGSLFTYLDCFSNSYADYTSKVDGVSFTDTFNYLAMHTPFSGLVKAGHRKMMREHSGWRPEQIVDDFSRRVSPSLKYPSRVGNLCSASVYLALASTIDHAPVQGCARVGMFSYGSGCSSEFFSVTIDESSHDALAKMDIKGRLDQRYLLSFAEYQQILTENLRCLQAVEHRKIDTAGLEKFHVGRPSGQRMLALDGIENYHRKYRWI